MSPRVKRLIPWVLSLSIVGFLFLTTDIDAVGAALTRADWPRLIGAMALVTLAACLVDSFTLVALFRRFVGRVGVKELLGIKGVSYFLNAINYSLAMGGMAWVLHKRRDIPFLETFSSLVWLFFVDIIALCGLITFGLALGPEAIGDSQAVARIPMVVAIIWAVVIGSLVYWNGGFDFFVLGRLRNWRVFDTFRRARLRDYPAMVVFRSGFVMVYVLMHWAILPAFDVHIDLGHLLLYAPLIAFVQVIPATISGLGAVQGVMLALFTPHVAPEAGGSAAILAYSTVIGPLMMLMRLVIGYIFVSSVARDLVPTKDQVEAARHVAELD